MILACFGLPGVLGASSIAAAQEAPAAPAQAPTAAPKAPAPQQAPPAASARKTEAEQVAEGKQADPVTKEAEKLKLLPQGARDDEKVQALFDQAVEAFDKGELEQAWDLLTRAWHRNGKQSFDIAGNMGLVALKQGRMTLAAEYLSTALQKFPISHDPNARRSLQEKLAQARQHVAVVLVRVDPPAAEVVVNGQRYPMDRIERGELFLPPGKVVIEAQADGYVPERQVRAVDPGKDDHVVLALRKEPSLWPGLAVGAAGLGGLAVGAGLMVAGAGEASEAETLSSTIVGARNSCVAGASNLDERCSTLDATARRADTLHDVGLGLLVGGGVALAGAGGYLMWRELKRSGETAAPTFVVTPTVDTAKAAVAVSGAF